MQATKPCAAFSGHRLLAMFMAGQSLFVGRSGSEQDGCVYCSLMSPRYGRLLGRGRVHVQIRLEVYLVLSSSLPGLQVSNRYTPFPKRGVTDE